MKDVSNQRCKCRLYEWPKIRKNGKKYMYWVTSGAEETCLHHGFLPSFSVQLQLQLPHALLSLPQLLSSPPLGLLALSLQVRKLLGSLLQRQLQLLHSAAQVLVLLWQPNAGGHMSQAHNLTRVPTLALRGCLTLMSMVLDWEGMVDSCCSRPCVRLRFCFRLSFSADRHRTRFSESVAPCRTEVTVPPSEKWLWRWKEFITLYCWTGCIRQEFFAVDIIVIEIEGNEIMLVHNYIIIDMNDWTD